MTGTISYEIAYSGTLPHVRQDSQQNLFIKPGMLTSFCLIMTLFDKNCGITTGAENR